MFSSVTDAISWIESIKRFGDKLDLSRMELACEILGHPERELPVIHIAGTNGKGSTVTYLKHMLLEQGYHVGTYTSPYIVRFNERITYDYNDISDEELLMYINKVYDLHHQVLQDHEQVITFFELITLISFLFFQDKKLDYCIYEVGLGGRLDATNVVVPMITAITSISYDHMGVLGDTLESIAWNKLGIVKPGAPLVTTVTQDELMPLFERMTSMKDVDLIRVTNDDIDGVAFGKETSFIYKEETYHISMMGYHQVLNASLAIEIIKQLELRNKVSIQTNKLKRGLLGAYWPGRLERFGNIILDGAHNVGGAESLLSAMQSYFADKRITVLYTSMADKEYFDVIQLIEQFADEIYFTEFDYPRCEDAQNLFDVSTHPKKHLALDAKQALADLRTLGSDEILVITGSLYFVSYMRKEL